MARRLSRRTTLAVIASVLLTVAAAFAIASRSRIPATGDALRARVIATLSERLDAEVELGRLTLRLWPSVRASGEALVIRHRGRRDVPPLIAIRAFSVQSSIPALLRQRVQRVELEGLEISIPPDDEGDRSAGAREPDEDAEDERDRRSGTAADGVVIHDLVSTRATITFVPRDGTTPGRTWAVHDLRMENVGAGRAMPFAAVLTNAVPPGEIGTTGSFGPWHAREPGRTPLSGAFTFRDADLAVFKGISGLLSAEGRYSGQLGRIEVQGTTDTPDFTVSVGGNPVHLEATYLALVNGTDGDTRLEHVDARFLDTRILAAGDVRHAATGEGREVVLAVTLEESKLEDVLRLAIAAPEPPMTGDLALETRFLLPPGDRDVVEKLELEGAFTIANGRFTNEDVQRQINGLSQKARGERAREGSLPASVTSDFSGRFRLGGGALRLTPVTFDIPGAVVELTGSYQLREETLDFNGHLYMDAKVSETTSGWKSLLLKVVDPLFRKNGRTVVPLKVEGTREAPDFGLDLGRVFGR